MRLMDLVAFLFAPSRYSVKRSYAKNNINNNITVGISLIHLNSYPVLGYFLNEGRRGFFHVVEEQFLLNVLVLFEKVFHCVCDRASVVLDPKLNRPKTLVSTLHKVGVLAELVMQFLYERLVCCLETNKKKLLD